MEEKYIYFVSYSHSNGFGNVEIIRNEKINNWKDIHDITKVIEELKVKNVIILNYIQLCV